MQLQLSSCPFSNAITCIHQRIEIPCFLVANKSECNTVLTRIHECIIDIEVSGLCLFSKFWHKKFEILHANSKYYSFLERNVLSSMFSECIIVPSLDEQKM